MSRFWVILYKTHLDTHTHTQCTLTTQTASLIAGQEWFVLAKEVIITTPSYRHAYTSLLLPVISAFHRSAPLPPCLTTAPCTITPTATMLRTMVRKITIKTSEIHIPLTRHTKQTYRRTHWPARAG